MHIFIYIYNLINIIKNKNKTLNIKNNFENIIYIIFKIYLYILLTLKIILKILFILFLKNKNNFLKNVYIYII